MRLFIVLSLVCLLLLIFTPTSANNAQLAPPTNTPHAAPTATALIPRSTCPAPASYQVTLNGVVYNVTMEPAC